MAAPDSASFRCLNALRYLVRSYVTRPTTMRAITEIPAKTPSPMGRTEIDFPGTENALVGVFDDCAANADTDEVLSAAAVTDAAASVLELDGIVTAVAAIDEKPLTITPEPEVDAAVVADVVKLDEEVDDEEVDDDKLVEIAELAEVVAPPSGVSVTVVKPFTEMAPPVPLEAVVVEVLESVVLVSVVEVDVEETEVVVVVVLDEELPLSLFVEPNVNLQSLTSCTAGLPF